MTKCPSCKENINFFEYTENCFRSGTYDLESEWTCYNTTSLEDGKDEYNCPECQEVLFNNEDDAKKFLQGDKGVSD